jgi:hypothetical protein
MRFEVMLCLGSEVWIRGVKIRRLAYIACLLHDNIMSVREWHTDHNDAAPKPIFKVNALAATHNMKIEGTFHLLPKDAGMGT